MPLTDKISYKSNEFNALINHDINFVVDNFHLFEESIDYWLTAASCFSSLEINQLLVEKGANPNFNQTENFTNAIFQNNLELVKFYVQHNCVLLGEDENRLGGAIMSAIEHDNLEMLKYLIELGCDIHLNEDYAFNRGIASNSIRCIQYLVTHHQMTYCPNVDYNNQQIIEKNYHQMLDYVLSLLKKPFNFSLGHNANQLFSKGKPEVFDVFVKHGLMNKENFIEYFENIIYYFPFQKELYIHLKNNYNDWFYEAIHKPIEDKKMGDILNFVLSQKYFDKSEQFNFEYFDIEEMTKIPFIDKFIQKNPSFISECFLKNILYKNNMDNLAYFYKKEFIDNSQIQSTLTEILPSLVDKNQFLPLLNIVFGKPFISEHVLLNKFYSYYKLQNSLNNNRKSIVKKI